MQALEEHEDDADHGRHLEVEVGRREVEGDLREFASDAEATSLLKIEHFG